MFPLRSSDPSRMAALRRCFEHHHFRERQVAERMGLASIFGIHVHRRAEVAHPADGFEALLQLFIEGRLLPASVVNAALGDADSALLHEAGLIGNDLEEPGSVLSTVALYPVQGLWLASDRWNSPVGRPSLPFDADRVFPAITVYTGGYLSLLPGSPCGDFLELCAGTGITALDAANRYAERACAVDITAPCCAYARWNAALNGLTNVEVAQGDTYGPFASRQFDRIAVHPPYVPSIKPTRIYADGGADGEHVTRAAIMGVPQTLRPGGRFYCNALVSDRRDRPWERRVRDILGAAADDFDVAVFQLSRMDAGDYLESRVANQDNTVEEAQLLHENFEQLGITHLLQAVTVIQRRASNRPAFTTRRTVAKGATSAELEWLLRLETTLADPTSRGELLYRPLTASPHVALRIDYALRNFEWDVTEAQLRLLYPFPTEFHMPEWAARMIGRCQGVLTGHQLWELMKQQEGIDDEARGRFFDLIFMLVGAGFVTPAGYDPPPQPIAAESRATQG